MVIFLKYLISKIVRHFQYNSLNIWINSRRIISAIVLLCILGCGTTYSKKEGAPSLESKLSDYIESNGISRFSYSKLNNSTNRFGNYHVSKYIKSTATVFLLATNYDTIWSEPHDKKNFSTTEIRFSIPECQFSTKEIESLTTAIANDSPNDSVKIKAGLLLIKSEMPNGIQYKAGSGFFEIYNDSTTIILKSLKHADELKEILDEIKSKYSSSSINLTPK